MEYLWKFQKKKKKIACFISYIIVLDCFPLILEKGIFDNKFNKGYQYFFL